MIVGSAVETIVVLSNAVNSAASRPARTSRIWRWVISGAAPGDADRAAVLSVTVMGVCPPGNRFRWRPRSAVPSG